MSEPPYRALRIVLGFLSLLLALGGLLLIFSSRGLILRVFMHPPESEISTLLLAAVKEMGGIVLTLSVMLFLAARDPERNVAIIDGMTLGLCIRFWLRVRAQTEWSTPTVRPLVLTAEPDQQEWILQ